MKRHYEYAIGKTIENIIDQSDSDHESIILVFTDGSELVVRGSASGADVEYEGLYYKFTEKQND